MTHSPTMTYRSLGACGTKVSTFSLGGWTTFGGSVKDSKVVSSIIKAAYAAGINFFDIADIYANGASETAMGKVLKGFKRHSLVISSKLFFPMSEEINDRGLSRKHIFESVHKSLKRIGTDYIDLYFCHRHDPDTPMEETIRAMDDLIHQGKILYWGTSQWTGEQMRQAHAICAKHNLYKPQIEQPQFSLIARERFEKDTAPAAKELGMGTVVWSPLGSGVLTGKYDNGVPKGSRLSQIGWLKDALLKDEFISRVKQFKTIADDLGVSRSQLALAWAARHPQVSSVILGATKLPQLKDNLGALGVSIDAAMIGEIDKLFPCKSWE